MRLEEMLRAIYALMQRIERFQTRDLGRVLCYFFAFVGPVCFLAMLPLLPELVWGAIVGEREAKTILLNSSAIIGWCWVQWEWRHIVWGRAFERPGAREDHNGDL